MGIPIGPPPIFHCLHCPLRVHQAEHGVWLHWGYLSMPPDHYAEPDLKNIRTFT
jgi:hypothetical protein